MKRSNIYDRSIDRYIDNRKIYCKTELYCLQEKLKVVYVNGFVMFETTLQYFYYIVAANL